MLGHLPWREARRRGAGFAGRLAPGGQRRAGDPRADQCGPGQRSSSNEAVHFSNLGTSRTTPTSPWSSPTFTPPLENACWRRIHDPLRTRCPRIAARYPSPTRPNAQAVREAARKPLRHQPCRRPGRPTARVHDGPGAHQARRGAGARGDGAPTAGGAHRVYLSHCRPPEEGASWEFSLPSSSFS